MSSDYIHFKDSIMFNIEQIARYVDHYGKKFFEEHNFGITNEEFRTLDVLICNPTCCQRDLAKLILRDRTRVGRIIDSLENKGLIKRVNDTKGKRLVKRMEITEKGIQCYEYCLSLIKPGCEKISKNFSPEQIKNLKELLKQFQDAISSLVDIQV